jgi:hypothetical protein
MNQPRAVTITAIRPARQPGEPAPSNSVVIELDERAVLYPAGKGVTRVTMTPQDGGIAFDAVFAFNESRVPSRIVWLSLADAREFGRALVDSVYQARPQNAITETMHIGITVHTNGFHIMINPANHPVELFIGMPSIWRFALTVLRAIDRMSPVQAH